MVARKRPCAKSAQQPVRKRPEHSSSSSCESNSSSSSSMMRVSHGSGNPADRSARLSQVLEGIEKQLEEFAAEEQAGEVDVPTPPSTKPRECNLTVIIGTSKMAEDSEMVARITEMVNESYFESIKELLHPRQKSYERLSADEVVERLCMGDAGPRANRVLHIAYLGEAPSPSSVVGCMSSTFQPPWTPNGCGHWGLAVVHKDHQGKGIASALVRAAEERLAGACDEIQIEYEYAAGHTFSDRLMNWYEGSLGYKCNSGRPAGFSRSGGMEFRRCRKAIPEELQRRGQCRRLKALRDEISSELISLCAQL